MTSASAVNVVPVSSFPVAGALDGTEIVPIVQAGLSKQTTVAAIASTQGDVPEATVRGRATGAGTGPVQNLTELELGDLVWEDFSVSYARRDANANNVGYINVPAIGASTRDAANNDNGQGFVVASAVSRTYTLPSDATDPEIAVGWVATYAVTDAGGSLVITPGAGATLLDLRDGTSGAKTITGVGIATVWKTAANFYTVNGSANLA